MFRTPLFTQKTEEIDMQCFNHIEKPAIGICKECAKGLCKDCMSDLGHGLACKNQHEEQVEAVHLLIEKNKKLHNARIEVDATVTAKAFYALPLSYLLLGLIFTGFGYFKEGELTGLPFMVGCVFLISFVYRYITNRNLYKIHKKNQ